MDIPKPRSLLADVTTKNNKINRENTKGWPKIKAEPTNEEDASETDLEHNYSIRELIVFKEDLENLVVCETTSKFCHYGVELKTQKTNSDAIVFKEKFAEMFDDTLNKHSEYEAELETHVSFRDLIVFEEDTQINMDNDVKPDKRHLGTVTAAKQFQRRKTSVMKVKSEAPSKEDTILSETDLAHHQSFKNSIVFKEDLEGIYKNPAFKEEIVKSEFFQGVANLRDNTFAYGGVVKTNEKKHKQIYTCKCGNKFTRKDFFDKHICKTEYKCDHCGKIFHRKHKILEHIQIHILTGELKQLLFDQKCTICPRKFKLKTSLEKHMEMHKKPHKNPPELYECDICHKEFTLMNNLKRHQKLHLGTVFKCDKCSKTYSRNASLQLHEVKKHGDIPQKESIVSCRFCSKVHYDKSNRNRHERLYCLSNPVRSKRVCTTRIMQCDICQKTYRHKQSLVDHILLHMGKKPNADKRQEVQCDVCFKKFTRKQNLKFHMESIHLNIKSHFCIKCKKGFTRKYILTNHKKKCQGISKNMDESENKFRCSLCSNKYKTKFGLIYHIDAKHLNVNYICKYCKATYTRKWSLICHEKKCPYQAHNGN